MSKETAEEWAEDLFALTDETGAWNSVLATLRSLEEGLISSRKALEMLRCDTRVLSCLDAYAQQQVEKAFARTSCQGKCLHVCFYHPLGVERAIEEQVEAVREEIRWLDEFVVEPGWFPNWGDRQYWRERRAAIRALAKSGV